MKSRASFESGQAIVLLVISLVVLLGFTALALDGGMAYSDRRQAQNIADTAALAGGGAAASGLVETNLLYSDFMEQCNSGGLESLLDQAELAAEARRDTNIQNIAIDNFVAEAICAEDVNSRQRYIEVRTSLTSHTPTSLAHLLFSGPLRSTVEAVTRVYPLTPFYEGHAIVSLNSTCDSNGRGGVDVLGGGGQEYSIYVNGGSIHSNSCIYGNGNTITHVSNGNIDYALYPTENPSGRFWAEGGISGGASLYGIEEIEVACPTTLSPTPHHTQDYPENSPLQPGRYSQISRNGGQMYLAPGLYCVDGDVSILGSSPVLRGAGVTFYLPSGSFSTSATADVILSACGGDVDCEDGAIEGLLIYLTGHGQEVELLGSANSSYTGTVYAPYGTVQVGGTSSLANEFNTQIIAGNVIVHGNANININYNLSQNMVRPAKMDMYR
jgi:hypothetical protein